MNITAFRAATVNRKRHVQLSGFEDEWVYIAKAQAERLFEKAQLEGLDVHVEHKGSGIGHHEGEAYITFNPRRTDA